MRSRQLSEVSIDSVVYDGFSSRDSGAERDGIGTRSNLSLPQGGRNNVASSSKSSASNGRTRPSRPPTSPSTPGSEGEMSPTHMAAIQAFQRAGRRRNLTLDDEEYEKQKEREIAIQKDRQRRIQEKVPGRKVGRHRPGDIDGKL